MSQGPGSDTPRRIACLSLEAAEILDRLGAGDRVAAVKGFPHAPGRLTDAPGGASFGDVDLEAILAARPDLILMASGSPAGLSRELGRRGARVMEFHPRSLEEILRMIVDLGKTVGLPEAGREVSREIREGLEKTREKGEALLRRPRTFFEECPDPLVTCAGWISELLEYAGGEDIFHELRPSPDRKDRIVSPAEVARREPELILASWAGNQADFERIRLRPGWDRVPAVRRGKIFGIEHSLVQRPGIRALTEGAARLHDLIAEASLG